MMEETQSPPEFSRQQNVLYPLRIISIILKPAQPTIILTPAQPPSPTCSAECERSGSDGGHTQNVVHGNAFSFPFELPTAHGEVGAGHGHHARANDELHDGVESQKRRAETHVALSKGLFTRRPKKDCKGGGGGGRSHEGTRRRVRCWRLTTTLRYHKHESDIHW